MYEYINKINNKSYYIIAKNQIFYSLKVQNKKILSVNVKKEVEFVVKVNKNIYHIQGKPVNISSIKKMFKNIDDMTCLSIIQVINNHSLKLTKQKPISLLSFTKKIANILTNFFCQAELNLIGGFNYNYIHSTLYKGNLIEKQCQIQYSATVIKLLQQDYFNYKANEFLELFNELNFWVNLNATYITKFNFSNNIFLSSRAFSKIINAFILLFYADQVLSDKSLIHLSNLNKKIFSNGISLISAPPLNIKFDREGNYCCQKNIILDGKILSLISDEKSLKQIKSIYAGNAAIDEDKLDHYNLLAIIPPYNKSTSINKIEIIDFLQINIIENTFAGKLIYMHDNKLCKSEFIIDVLDFFSNIFSIPNTYQCFNNVLCPDIIYNRENKTETSYEKSTIN